MRSQRPGVRPRTGEGSRRLRERRVRLLTSGPRLCGGPASVPSLCCWAPAGSRSRGSHRPARRAGEAGLVILGGAKVKDEIGVLRSLTARADTVLVGGGMSFTFLRALGHTVGASLIDPTHLEACKELLASPGHIILPVDRRALAPGRKLSIEAQAESEEPVADTTGPDVETFGLRDSPKAGEVSTSGRPRWSCSQRSSPRRARFFGTGRWACSRTTALPREPRQSPRRSQAGVLAVSSAAETSGRAGSARSRGQDRPRVDRWWCHARVARVRRPPGLAALRAAPNAK